MKWTQVTLGQLLDANSASIQTGPFGTQLRASDYIEHGVPVINVRNIGFGTLKTAELEYLDQENADRLSVHLLKEKDIVFGRKGAVERHLLVSSAETGWIQGSDCIRFRLNTPDLLPEFLSYALLHPNHQAWMIAQSGSKATMASLNQGIIGRIPLSLPPVSI